MELLAALKQIQKALETENNDLIQNCADDFIKTAVRYIYENRPITDDMKDEIRTIISDMQFIMHKQDTSLFVMGQIYSILKLLDNLYDIQEEDRKIQNMLPLIPDMVNFLESLKIMKSIKQADLHVSWKNYIEYLKKNGLFIIERKVGRTIYYRLTPMGRRLLEKAKEVNNNAH